METTIAFVESGALRWQLSGQFSRAFIAGFLYGGLYGTFQAYPRLKMDIEFGRYRYYFTTQVPPQRPKSITDREALINSFPNIFASTLEDTIHNFDQYEKQDIYRLWLRDIIQTDKRMHISTESATEFLQGLFSALTAYNIQHHEVLLSPVYYNGIWSNIKGMNLHRPI